MEESKTRVSYKKLWHILLDRDMMKKDLQEKAQLSTTTMSKLGRDGNVTMDVLVKICEALQVQLTDIVEIEGIAKVKAQSDHLIR